MEYLYIYQVQTVSISYLRCLIEHVRCYILDRDIELIYYTIRKSSDVLTRDPMQLGAQVIDLAIQFSFCVCVCIAAIVIDHTFEVPCVCVLNAHIWVHFCPLALLMILYICHYDLAIRFDWMVFRHCLCACYFWNGSKNRDTRNNIQFNQLTQTWAFFA